MKFKSEQIPLLHHPANIAWKRLSQNGKEAGAIELLVQDNGKPRNNKSVIYRLSGAGINGHPVIAKQGPLEKLENERFIYQRILAGIPVPHLHFYGFVPDSDNKTAWIFLEEGQGRSYSEDIEADRILVAGWLGMFHAATNRLENKGFLKKHGAEEYYRDLESARAVLSGSRTAPWIRSVDVTVLDRIILNLDIIESRWVVISKLCEQMPGCVVHGDFIRKNVTIDSSGQQSRVNVFDWEYAGRGVPAVDLGALDYTFGDMQGRDVDSYMSSIHECWTDIDKATIQQWINLGLLFRYLAWISTTGKGLDTGWVSQPMHELENYNTRMTMVLEKLEWI